MSGTTAIHPDRGSTLRQTLAAFPDAARRYMATVAHYGRHIRPVRGRLGLALGSTVVMVLARLAEPWPVKLIVDGVFLSNPPAWLSGLGPWFEAGSLSLLGILVAALPLIALVSSLARYQQRIQATEAALGIGTRLRKLVFDHVQRLSAGFHARLRAGDLVTRVTSDVRILRDAFVTTPVRTFEEFLLAAGMLAVMLAIDWQLSLVALVLLPVLGIVFRKHEQPMKQAVRKQRARESEIATTASDALSALPAVQAFGREKSEVKRFGKAASKDLSAGLKAARLEGRLMLASEWGIGVAGALIVGLAVLRIQAGAMTVGDLVVFATYLATFFQPIRHLARTMRRLQRAIAAGERVGEILAETPTVAESPTAGRAPDFRGHISFDHVGYAHRAGNSTLEDVTLEIRPGERLALLGPSGAGKSTLLSMVPRFIDPVRGAVRIDGTDLRDITLDGLRRQVAVVFQQPLLLRATVAENIVYGRPDATVADIQRVVGDLGITDLIESLPEGYATRVGERGALLSGGQRQCVTIARAMMLDAPIVLLDEPLTGIDPEMADLVSGALRRLSAGRTTIIITHDTGLLAADDRVVWLSDGRIAADGPWSAFRDSSVVGEARKGS